MCTLKYLTWCTYKHAPVNMGSKELFVLRRINIVTKLPVSNKDRCWPIPTMAHKEHSIILSETLPETYRIYMYPSIVNKISKERHALFTQD